MCSLYSNLFRIICKTGANVRQISIQSCDLARGNRLTVQNCVFEPSSNNKLEQNIKKVNHEIISLDVSEIKVLENKRQNSSAPATDKTLSENKFSDTNLPYYTKLGDSDKKFGILMHQLRSKKEREQRRQILLEGQRLIQDALDAGVRPYSIYFSHKESLAALKVPEKCPAEIFKLQYKQLQLWSNLTTSPGIVGVFEVPAEPELKNLGDEDSIFPFTLVCDNVREPGNMGAILRVAAGVGCQQVLLTKGCVDLWEPKVLRSGAGAHFRVKAHQKVPWEDIHHMVVQECASVYLADNRSDTDSAGSVVHDYTQVDFSSEPGAWVLVLGGETKGLSAEAKYLAQSAKHHSRLHIPLAGNMDSLNVGTALAVIMFEMRRQRLLSFQPRECSTHA